MRDISEFNELNQFDSNPTDDPDLMEMIADTWIEKALYYGIKKNHFSWHESWVVVDGVKYNISINNTEKVGNRCCASLDIELRHLKRKLEKIEQIVNTEVDPNICNNVGDVRKVQAIRQILEQE